MRESIESEGHKGDRCGGERRKMRTEWTSEESAELLRLHEIHKNGKNVWKTIRESNPNMFIRHQQPMSLKDRYVNLMKKKMREDDEMGGVRSSAEPVEWTEEETKELMRLYETCKDEAYIWKSIRDQNPEMFERHKGKSSLSSKYANILNKRKREEKRREKRNKARGDVREKEVCQSLDYLGGELRQR
jgi:hypothetical protein